MRLNELRDLLDRHVRSDMSTSIEDVLISRVDRPEPPLPSMTGTVMALIAQGTKRLALGDRVYQYGPGQYLVASVDLPVTGQFLGVGPQQPAIGFGLVLRPAAIAEVLQQATDVLRPARKEAVSGLAVSNASEELLDAVIRLLRLLEHPRDRDVLAPLIKREIIWRLITSDQGTVIRQLGLTDSSLAAVARTVQWIRDHYRDPFRVEHLAQLAGMSLSAFYRNFQAVTAMSPIQFQKQLRLQQARILLASHPSDIAGVGRRVGYANPSQFSREYRRQFGTPPGQDAAHLHNAPHPHHGTPALTTPGPGTEATQL